MIRPDEGWVGASQPTPEELEWWLSHNADADLLTTLESNFYRSQAENAQAHLATAARFYASHPDALTPPICAAIRALYALAVKVTSGVE